MQIYVYFYTYRTIRLKSFYFPQIKNKTDFNRENQKKAELRN